MLLNKNAMANLKSMNIGKNVTKITLEHTSTEKSINQLNELRAIAILLGGYNEFGRGVSTEEYEQVKERFNECIDDLKHLLTTK